ncbi:MAG: glycosyltransferase family 2 protein, partial [Prevotellaceae bacterium]|nr:glycosyltransferase family 2 protein [Prevotellaceae bacterium]
MINYTIIIPHKNIPILLARCLNSIPQRADVQVIVADDNSDEQNIMQLKSMLSSYPGVEFIFGKNENGRTGAGYARNLAMEKANGKWLVFIDADDYFTPEFAAAMDKYKDKSFDIVYFRVTAINEKTGKRSKRAETPNYLVECGKNGDIDKLKFERVNVYGKFVSLQLVRENNILFQECKVANDVWFSLISAFYAQKINISDYEIYCITERTGSLEFSPSFKRKKLYFNTDIEIYNKLKTYHLEHHLEGHICYWWKQMKKKNPLCAMFYYRKMVKLIGKKNK